MIKYFCPITLLLLFAVGALAQADRQLADARREFERTFADAGARAAFLAFLADDGIIFNPAAVNGKEFWRLRDNDPTVTWSRYSTHSDFAANGNLGYSTGNWRRYQKGKSESAARFGQYVTIWEKQPDGQFRVSLDIAISHDKLPFTETDLATPKQRRDLNKRGWSPIDASMNFLKMSMGSSTLGEAYKKFAGDDIRLLRDESAPISGKKAVVARTRDFVSIKFPTKVALFQSADMAYTWNACEFDNSNEGYVAGNCLHIWKLRNKKWWIVLGVIAVAPNETPPTLKTKVEKND